MMWEIVAALFVGAGTFLCFPFVRVRKFMPNERGRKNKEISEEQLLHFALSFRLELESGALCEPALAVALETLPTYALPLTRSAIASQSGIADAMHADSRALPLLRDLSLAIALSQKQGSQLGGSLKVMTDSIQSRIQTQHLLRSELASVRATIAVLAALPLLGIAFATLLGARPIPWLVGSSIGRYCVVVAAVLEATGMLWTKALVTRAVREET